MKSIRRFSTRSLHGRIAHIIGRRIIGGDYEEGETLPNEDAFGIELSVSRTALREAFKVLAAKGLLESKPKVGTKVKHKTQWNMLDPDVLAWHFETSPSVDFLKSLFEMRQIFEPNAAAMAAKRRTDEQLQVISDAYYAMENTEQDTQAVLDSDLAFHLGIVDASGNPFMHSMGMMIETALMGSFHLSSAKPRAQVSSLPAHKAVFIGIRDKDPERARFEMQQLLDKAVEDARYTLLSNHELSTENFTL
ncbi:MAG: FadR family transcriptional regulator [Oceanospirillaceae bacterium]|nr:FadR family transcriptional regulator [Oceanospirillaceae bacterium]